VAVEATGRLEHLPAAVEVAAYRIISEAVTNASRHSMATKCTIRIDLSDTLRIRVDDNGAGMSESTPHGSGVPSIRMRASELGGTADVNGGPAGGTVVTATIPLSARGDVGDD
jgi:signal transduction histidine kinase